MVTCPYDGWGHLAAWALWHLMHINERSHVALRQYQPPEGVSSTLRRKEHLTTTLLQEHPWRLWIAFRTTREKPDLHKVFFLIYQFAIGVFLTNPTKGGVKQDNSKAMIASLNSCTRNANPQMDKITHVYLVYLQRINKKTKRRKRTPHQMKTSEAHTKLATMQHKWKLFFAFSTLLKSHLFYLLYYTVMSIQTLVN